VGEGEGVKRKGIIATVSLISSRAAVFVAAYGKTRPGEATRARTPLQFLEKKREKPRREGREADHESSGTLVQATGELGRYLLMELTRSP